MFSSLAFSERTFSDQTILLAGVAELSAIAATTNVASGVMSGVSSVDANFTQTGVALYVSAGANADLSFDYTKTSEGTRLKGSTLNSEILVIESAFTETSNSIMIRSGISLQDLNFTKATLGEIKYAIIEASTTSIYTEITINDNENYTEITPSGTETWTEIQ